MSEQQWQEDVKQFGELAYLMYELQCLGMYFDGIKPTGKYRTFVANHEWDYNSKFDIRRKQSAALDFDKAAALAGDAVEILTCNEWLDCSNDYALYLHDNEGHDNKNSKTHLRMKHPRRVGVDYSQFEDKS